MYIRWNYIEEEMKIKKINNTQIAQLLGISRDTWHKYKNGDSDITLKAFYKLLQTLDLNFDDVIKDNELVNEEEVRAISKERIKEVVALKDNINKFKELTKDKPKLTTKFNTDRVKK